MRTKTKKLVAIVLLLAVSSGVIITALVMLPSPVKHAITPELQLEDLTNMSENITRLTTNPGPDENPVWSPDGKKIFFESRPDIGVSRYGPECYICVMDADGSNLTRLANGTDPVLSPDGIKVFFKHVDDHLHTINFWVMNTDGSNKKKLTSLNITVYPILSPDRSKICYYTEYHTGYWWVSWKNGTWTRFDKPQLDLQDMNTGCAEQYGEIWIMDVYGKNKNKIASDIDMTCIGPILEWSPDGKRILFQASTLLSSGNPIENIDIWIMDADGSNKKQLTNYSGYDTNPEWSPDGNKIAYGSGNLSNLDIWTMNPNGSDKKQLTSGALVSGTWSLDGRKIAYVSWLTEDPKAKEIWIMDADGSNKELLLSVPCNPSFVGIGLAWSPDGSKIALDYHLIGVVNSDIYVIEVPATKEVKR